MSDALERAQVALAGARLALLKLDRLDAARAVVEYADEHGDENVPDELLARFANADSAVHKAELADA